MLVLLCMTAYHSSTVTHFLVRLQPRLQTISTHYLQASLPTLVEQISAIQNHSVIGYYKGINQHAKAVILSGYISH